MKIYLVIPLLFLSFSFYSQTMILLSQVIKIEEATDITSGFIETQIPLTLLNRQKIIDVQFSPKPTKKYDKLGLPFVSWDLVDFEEGDSIVINYSLLINRYDLSTAKKISRSDIETPNLAKYLKHEIHFQKDNKKINKQAKKLAGLTNEKTVENIFNFVTNHLEYKSYFIEKRGAKKALKQGLGDCTEYSELMISLCRANNIPSRIVLGNTIGSNNRVGLHNWVEVYFEEYGWVPFDPTFADLKGSLTEFSKMYNRYIYFANERHTYKTNWKWFGQFCEIKLSNNWEDLLMPKYLEALSLYRDGENENALLVIDSLISVTPGNYVYQMFKGVTHARLNEFDKGLKALQIAHQCAYTKQDLSSIYYSFANYFALKGDTELALTYLKKSLDLGFLDYKHIKTDKDLESLFELKEFVELTKEKG